MTSILFSFDVEDYINPIGAEGVLRTAQILQAEGIRGCYCTVARIAQAFVQWGRQDVLDALKAHEIDLHSMAHSHHPTINEYTDIADFDEAMRRFLQNEIPARRILTDITGQTAFPAACPPGDSVSYVAHYGYAGMGVPLYVGDLLYDERLGRPVTCCGIASLHYTFCLDEFLIAADERAIDELLDEMAAKEVCILYHHPAMDQVSRFWDEVNFNGANTPEDQWQLSPRRPAEDVERFFANFTCLAHKVKTDPRFQPMDYAQLSRQYAESPRVITPSLLPLLKQQLEDDFFPVTLPDSFCLSDLLLSCRDLLLGKPTHECGKVYGFLDTPLAIRQPVTISASDLRASASQIGDGFLPASLRVGSQTIGPADWLRAALAILCGAEEATITPGPWQIDLNQFPSLRDLTHKGTWIHAPSMEDRYLSDRFRLQSWTIRLPKGSARKIF